MINQVTLVGRLTRDPDLRITPEGNYVCNITLAVNRQYKNQKGEVDADFVHCTLWRKSAENTSAYCKKGSLIGITGRIQTRNYQNAEGKRTYITEVIAENVKFIGPRRIDERPPQRVTTPTQAPPTEPPSVPPPPAPPPEFGSGAFAP